ncbi:serine/threonine-protein kinase [Mycobacterium sp. Marseille-P9652]|uniref:serine/threonine-protein kinase n=1 Tax=Mycobacterium sp. Marseille-P9652 TaxID=2654950 RepID=UPI001E427662|nr:serine/threonine-protein kinase [Mycobacterium sp. Marseille-P9652]
MGEDPAVGRPADSRVGSLFGPYRLTRLLGAGGFGEVYEAEDTAMHRVVALKVLSGTFSQDPVFRERLFREARTAGRLREPHVLPIHGCGEIDGQVYIDMRLVRGVDLATLLQREGPLEPGRAVSIVRQVADALDAAHAETVIHRDVKPANILLAGDGFASLVDFGLANAAGDARLTKPGTAVGTFDYVAPERLTGEPVDHRCDVYALACVLYELLTGRAPYSAHRELPELMAAHMTAPIPVPSRQRPGIPAGFDAVVARGMAKNPGDRYQSAGQLAAAAEAVVAPARRGPAVSTTQPWESTPAPPPAQHPSPAVGPPPPRRGSRRRLLTIVAALAVVVATAATVAAIAITHRRGPAQQAASRPRPSSTAPVTLPFPKLALPRGVALDGRGTIYVAELTPHSPNGRILELAEGRDAPVELPFGDLFAEGVAVDAHDNVYATDTHASAVWQLTPGARGPHLMPFGPLGNPVGVAAGKDGSVYVADQALKEVLKLSAGDTQPTRLMPTTPLDSPVGIAVDGDSNVYVVDSGGRHVLKLGAGASIPTELPFGGLDAPYGVAAAKDGTVYVSDPFKHRVWKLPSGAAASAELHFPGLNYPRGLATDEAGEIYVVDCNNADSCTDGRVLELGAGA